MKFPVIRTRGFDPCLGHQGVPGLASPSQLMPSSFPTLLCKDRWTATPPRATATSGSGQRTLPTALCALSLLRWLRGVRATSGACGHLSLGQARKAGTAESLPYPSNPLFFAWGGDCLNITRNIFLFPVLFYCCSSQNHWRLDQEQMVQAAVNMPHVPGWGRHPDGQGARSITASAGKPQRLVGRAPRVVGTEARSRMWSEWWPPGGVGLPGLQTGMSVPQNRPPLPAAVGPETCPESSMPGVAFGGSRSEAGWQWRPGSAQWVSLHLCHLHLQEVHEGGCGSPGQACRWLQEQRTNDQGQMGQRSPWQVSLWT